MSKTFSAFGHAPPSFLPSSPEQTSSSRRRDPAHDQRQQRKKLANDVSHRPVTDDIISNLLDSFSNISRNTEDTVLDLPTPYDFSPRYSLTRDSTNRPPFATTTKASRRSSFSLPFRDGFRPSFASRAQQTPEEHNNAHPVLRSEHEEIQFNADKERKSVEEEDDIALPPIVRMSRSSSTRARKPLQSFSKRQTSQQSLFAGQATPASNVTPRPGSLDGGYSNGNSVAVERREKGKQPIYQVTINAPHRPAENNLQPGGKGSGFDGPVLPPRISSRSARSSIGDGTHSTQRTSTGRSGSLNMTALQSIHDDSRRAATLNQASLRSISNELKLVSASQQVEIPHRTTSLYRILDSPVRPHRTQNTTETEVNEDRNVNEYHIAELPGSKTPTQEDYHELQDSEPPSLRLSEETQSTSAEDSDVPSVNEHRRDVMRRIAELKAASQARLGSLNRSRYNSATISRQASDEHMNFISPLPTPDTSLANGQLAQAQRLQEYVMEDSDTRPTRRFKPTYSDTSISSIPNATTLQVQKAETPSTIGIISTSSSRAPSMDSVRRSRVDDNTANTSRRSSRWSLSGPRPQTPVADAASRTLAFSRGGTRTMTQTTRPIIVTTPAPPEPKHSPDSIEEDIAAFLSSPRLSQSIIVDEGHRRITFSEIGDPKGHVVLCFVGMGMTRYVTAFYDELATSLKLRLITPDRPGIGDSESYPGGSRRPVDWPDDVQAICDHLGVREFSLLAHSAGAVYALATALRMSPSITGRIHLLAPWIPPSQMNMINSATSRTTNISAVPRGQRFLRLIPTPLLRLSTSSWVVNAGGGFRSKTPSTPSSPPKPTKTSSPPYKLRRSRSRASSSATSTSTTTTPTISARTSIDTIRHDDTHTPPRLSMTSKSTGWPILINKDHANMAFIPPTEAVPSPDIPFMPQNHAAIAAARARQQRYDAALTPAIFQLATRNGNPGVDLLVCLEKNQSIGFKYADVDVSATGGGIVIHHGSQDQRVPPENVRAMARWMNRVGAGGLGMGVRGEPEAVEFRVLEGEGHGLMASAAVMGSVLTEMGREVEEMGLSVSARVGLGGGGNGRGIGGAY